MIVGTPIRAVLSIFIEHGSPHRDVVGGGGQDVDGNWSGGDGFTEVVATGSAGVARCHQMRNALGSGLLPHCPQALRVGQSALGFAGAEAVRHDVGKVVVHDVKLGELDPVSGIGGSRHN